MATTELIGYKLRKTKFATPACRIEGYQCFGESIRDKRIVLLHSPSGVDRTPGFQRLKDAGVLDIYFKPVYGG